MTKFIVCPSTDKHVLHAAIIEPLQTEKYEDFDKLHLPPEIPNGLTDRQLN